MTPPVEVDAAEGQYVILLCSLLSFPAVCDLNGGPWVLSDKVGVRYDRARGRP